MARTAASPFKSIHAPADEFFGELGLKVAGPVLLGMTRWLIEEVRISKPDKILFLSRDGDILKQLWENLCPPDLAELPVGYLLASRRALRLATLETVDARANSFLTSQPVGLTVGQLFQRAGLLEGDYLPILSRKDGLSPSILYTQDLEPAVHQLFKELEPALLRTSENERKAYCSYLQSEGLSGNMRLAVVDVGWHGSLQLALANLLRGMGNEVETDGYYCGLFPAAEQLQTAEDRFHGFLLSGGSSEKRYQEIHRFVELVEFFFSSPGKSLLFFEETEKGCPEPVFCEENLSAYQTRALKALRAGCLALAEGNREYPEDPYPALKRLGLNPTPQEARFLAPLEAARGFGEICRVQPFARCNSPVHNLTCWRRFCGDFKNALWRPGFWAQLSPLERRLLRILSPEGTKVFP